MQTQNKGGDNMPREEHHIVPNKNGGWDVKRNGSEEQVFIRIQSRKQLTKVVPLAIIKTQNL